jgi:hypothetical protein
LRAEIAAYQAIGQPGEWLRWLYWCLAFPRVSSRISIRRDKVYGSKANRKRLAQQICQHKAASRINWARVQQYAASSRRSGILDKTFTVDAKPFRDDQEVSLGPPEAYDESEIPFVQMHGKLAPAGNSDPNRTQFIRAQTSLK